MRLFGKRRFRACENGVLPCPCCGSTDKDCPKWCPGQYGGIPCPACKRDKVKDIVAIVVAMAAVVIYLYVR